MPTKKKSNLVIVESPAKAKTIEKYLGPDYEVRASKGHIVDLPKSGLAIDVDNDYKLDYAVMLGKSKVIAELKKAAEDKERVIIASDPDREGEAIGWHVANKLGLINLDGSAKKGKNKSKAKLERIVFTEITKEAIQSAIAHPRSLDLNLFAAQQTRRILDRLVGYKLSPLLWKKIRFGLSAGRVQSVAVKLIVDRERERSAFKSDEYWKLFSYLNPDLKAKKSIDQTKIYLTDEKENIPKPEGKQVRFDLVKVNAKNPELSNQKLSEKILNQLLKQSWLINRIESKEVTRRAKPPFTTSTLQQTAANWLGFSAKRTMSVAQSLYEKGFISYMRTDSTNFSNQAIESVRSSIKKLHGANYLPAKANFYKTKSKVAQEAHEAVRPSNFDLIPEKLTGTEEETKLYRLIWQRAMASQMLPAIVESQSVTVLHKFSKDSFEFKAMGQKLVFPGYLAVYPEKFSEQILPELVEQQELACEGLFASQHFTEPPARFSEATLIKELEKFGIGRPSTYAPIISTIQARQYVKKDNNYFTPTDVAFAVTKLLEQHFPEIVDKDFTAGMEEDLDVIADGKTSALKVLDSFYKPFAKNLLAKDKSITRDDFTVLGEAPAEIVCPDCGKEMQIKLGKFGKFYSCVNFPECKGILPIPGEGGDNNGKPVLMVDSDEFRETYKPGPKTDDGREYLLKAGRFGQFWAHPDYPKVKDAQPLQYLPAKMKEIYGEIPKTEDGREYLLKKGRFGEFWAHPDYPKVKDIIRIKKQKKKIEETVDGDKVEEK